MNFWLGLLRGDVCEVWRVLTLVQGTFGIGVRGISICAGVIGLFE